MSTMIDEDKLAAMEWARQRGLSATEQMELAQFQVGFPKGIGMEQIYISYIASKYGPEAITTDTQELNQ